METGHAINVANFEKMIAYCTGYGKKYNPSNSDIVIVAMQTLLGNSKNVLEIVSTAKAPFDSAVNARDIVFDQLKSLATRIVNALAATKASQQTIKDAKTLNKKIQGIRATPKHPDPVKPDDPKNSSSSQLSFDSLIKNFNELIKLLEAEPKYTPNETDLQTAGLNSYLTQMKTTNKAVVTLTPALKNARIERDKILYAPETGLYDIQGQVKNYVLSVYKANAPEYKQVKQIKFTNIK